MNTYNKSFRNLVVWKESKILTLSVYEITKTFPTHEIYGITSQLRRASSSIMANIAEGNDRNTNKDKIKFFCIARASLAETDCFLELAYDLKYIDKEEYSGQLNQLNKTAYLLS